MATIDANQYLARLASVFEQFKLARRMVQASSKTPETFAPIIGEEVTEMRDVFAPR